MTRRKPAPVVGAAIVAIIVARSIPSDGVSTFVPASSPTLPTTVSRKAVCIVGSSSHHQKRLMRAGEFPPPRERMKVVVRRGFDDISSRRRRSTSPPPSAILPPAVESLSLSPSASRKFRGFLAAVVTGLLVTLPAIVSSVRRLLWPNRSPDSSFSEPLPPAPSSLGCPFFGHVFQSLEGSKEEGNGSWYRKASAALDDPRVWRMYFVGRPRVVLRGGEVAKDVMSAEFEPRGLVSLLGKIGRRTDSDGRGGDRSISLLPTHSMLTETDRSRHGALRRLVGAALTPSAVSEAMPSLKDAAERQMERLSSRDPVKMEDLCKSFTQDVAWRQILGLDLAEDEIRKFDKSIDLWISGLFSVQTFSGIGLKSYPPYKAREYLVSKIQDKINELELDGPDSSTLSGMLFATDDERRTEGEGTTTTSPVARKMSREEVIDNALLLILAGSETSASTLTNTVLLLGMHPNAWRKVVEEQQRVRAEHGDDALTQRVLERECPYLDSVIKETLRIKPIVGGVPRATTETIVIDGKQVPKGWGIGYNVLLTHAFDPTTFKDDGSHMDIRQGYSPERWLDESTRPGEDFIPMGVGYRYCAGANLAFAEMKVFLSVLARRVPGLELAFDA